MGAIKNRKVAKIQTSYVKQQENEEIQAGRKKRLLYRRLAVFFTGAIALSFFMMSTLVSQSSSIEAKTAEKQKLEQELALLEKKEVALEEEIVKLNDDEYIAKHARGEYLLSENNEVIFILPEGKEKGEKKEKTSN